MKHFTSRACLSVLVCVLLAGDGSAHAPEPQAATAPANLASLFNVAGNLGFATIRVSYANPAEPLPQPVVDWLLRDFPSARQWAAGVAVCVPFDLARFDQAAGVSRSGALSRDVWPTIDRMHRDYAAAVGQAGCTLGLSSPQQLHAFFMGGLFMGFAVARASYFTGGPPLGEAVITQIRGDVPAIRAGLQAVSGCSPAIAGVNARLDAALQRMGAVSGNDSWQDLVGVYQAIEAAAQNSTCASRPPSPPAGELPCKDSKCAVPCKGAMTLMGVVSGSPECMACLDRFCKRPTPDDHRAPAFRSLSPIAGR